MRCVPATSAARPFRTMINLQIAGKRPLVGLSGGADSVALLLLMLDSGASPAAVHVNHGLRGAESDGDEAFVRELCRDLGVPLVVYRACPPENPGENWAREVRYGFFRQAMQSTGTDVLVLAHHRDDQAETMLLHLLRGAGLTGLSGMAADSWLDGIRILRPLLPYSRVELRAYLKGRNQAWREDATNGDHRYLRNALRGEVLPLLERLVPGASERMARAAEFLREDDMALNALAADFLIRNPGSALPIAALKKHPAGLQRRILRAWWTACAAPGEERSLSAQQSEAIHALVDGAVSATCNLPGGWHSQRGWTHLHLLEPGDAKCLPEMQALDCPMLETEDFSGRPGDGRSCQAVPREWLETCTVRSRRKGDFICPFGSSGRQSLQDYFVNRRVDAAFRDRVPLICRGSEVLLAGGVGAGGVPHVDQIRNPVLLRWKETFPWQQEHQEKGE